MSVFAVLLWSSSRRCWSLLCFPSPDEHREADSTLPRSSHRNSSVFRSEFMASLAVSFGRRCVRFWRNNFPVFGQPRFLLDGTARLASGAFLAARSCVASEVSGSHRMAGIAMRFRSGVGKSMLFTGERLKMIWVFARPVFAFVVNIEPLRNGTNKPVVRDAVGVLRVFGFGCENAVSRWRFATNPLPAIRLPIQLQLLSEALKQILWRSSCSHGVLQMPTPNSKVISASESGSRIAEWAKRYSLFCHIKATVHSDRAPILPISPSFAT